MLACALFSSDRLPFNPIPRGACRSKCLPSLTGEIETTQILRQEWFSRFPLSDRLPNRCPAFASIGRLLILDDLPATGSRLTTFAGCRRTNAPDSFVFPTSLHLCRKLWLSFSPKRRHVLFLFKNMICQRQANNY